MSKKPLINTAHILLGCRFDVWLRLLIENHFHIAPRQIPQALFITLASLLFFPFALLERLLLCIPISRQKPKGSLYILGHWRSGTTFLQNVLSKDPGRGFFDPVSTITVNNSVLLRPLLTPLLRQQLPNARPMDNLVYELDLPMEEIYALTNTCTLSFINMLAFPERGRDYISTAFVEQMSPAEQRRWIRAYTYLIKKQALICHGKPLTLKSPSNTACSGLLHRLYPDAVFVHIHRDPYEVIASTIHTFCKILGNVNLQQEQPMSLIEDVAMDLFQRVFRQLFRDMETIPPEQMLEIRYEEFEKSPLEHLRHIYEYFRLPGFEQAEPEFRSYLESQKHYQKNRLHMEARLAERINRELKFYFDRYGYEMKDPNTFSVKEV